MRQAELEARGRPRGRAFLLVGIALIVSLGSAPAWGVRTGDDDGRKRRFVLTSTAFEDGETIPVRYTCTADGISPPLAWANTPKRTKRLALIMEDPDAPSGTFVHWVLADFERKPASIDEGSDPVRALEGVNSAGRLGWLPPCPPPGPAHRYIFRLFALDTKVSLPPRATAATLRDAMKGTVLGKAKLVGHYGI